MDLKIFSGRSNEPLAKEIAGCISTDQGLLDNKRNHPDGEIYTRYCENLRGNDVFIVQSTNQPDANWAELDMLIHTAMLASAERITAVIPYFGYARQDRKDKSRAPVTVALKVRELVVAAGASRLLVLDVHSEAVGVACAALNVPSDHLWARPVFLDYIRESSDFAEFMEGEFVVAAPDLNAGKFARSYAESLGNVPIVLVEKRRDPSSGKTETLNVIGGVNKKNVLIVDDMIDTAGTLCDAAESFKEAGAKRIFALATHGLFSGRAIDKLCRSPIERIFVTNSVMRKVKSERALSYISVAPLLAEAISRIHNSESVSSLFE